MRCGALPEPCIWQACTASDQPRKNPEVCDDIGRRERHYPGPECLCFQSEMVNFSARHDPLMNEASTQQLALNMTLNWL